MSGLLTIIIGAEAEEFLKQNVKRCLEPFHEIESNDSSNKWELEDK